jgi:heptosyltransferase-2
MKLVPEKIKSVTVIKLDHIGDVILATPVIESLRIGFPKAMIRVVIGAWSKEVLHNNPNIDEVICYHPPWLDRSLTSNISEKREENKEALRLLLEIKHDLVVDLRRGDLFHIAFSSSISNKYLLAYKTDSEFDRFITHLVSVSSKDHVSVQQLKLLKSIGLKTGKVPQLYPSNTDIAWAKNQLSSHKPKIAIFTGAGAPIKKWPEKRFLKLCYRLHKLGFEIVLVGSDQEKQFAQVLSNRIHVLNFCGKTTLLQLASLLKYVHLLVSNDSAPVHLASSVETPVVVITKPNARIEYAPVGNNNSTVSYSHCKWGFNCPGFVFNQNIRLKQCRCIKTLSVEEVERAVYKTLLSSKL